jgi:uncharacterized metal-binding protein YceD (DUF177 family)
MNQIIDFNDIDENGPQTYRGTYDVTPGDLDRDEVAEGGKVEIEARADKGDLSGEYIIDGSARYTADLECSRCLEPYPFAHSSHFHVRFRPFPDGSAEDEEVEIIDKGELDVEFYSDRKIPLRDLAVEQIQLSIPMKPLCDESCLGLCPRCGANRSREECQCDLSITDERWDALKGIREQISKKNNV